MEKPKGRGAKEGRVLPDGDPSWRDRCLPLLDHLKKGSQTPKELEAWRRGQPISTTMLVQMLAWCENRKLITYYRGKWAFGWYKSASMSTGTSEDTS